MAKRRKVEAPRRKEEFSYRGHSVEELKDMDLDTVAQLFPARQRRKLKRELTEDQKKLLQKIREGKTIRTHQRDMIVLPEMIGTSIGVHDGKTFTILEIMPEMIGHYLGEYALTRRRVSHGGPGVGATRSSRYVPLK
ncbi:MAG: 30S ribosomal protein S19 [Halobacteriota archaeon]